MVFYRQVSECRARQMPFNRFLRMSALVVSIVLLGSTPSPAQSLEKAETFSTVLHRRETLHHLVSLPRDYQKEHKRWPVILYLHGAGDRGDDLNLVNRQGPPYEAEHEPHFPFIVVSPQLPLAEDVWAAYDRALIQLMERVFHRYRADRSCVYLTGISMGGMGVWQLAKENPGFFAAIVPLAGWNDPEWAPQLAHIPIWVFHGDQDDVVPPWASERMVKALRDAGGDPKLTLLPKLNHGIGPMVWARKDLYAWMLGHQVPARKNR
jgi:predicted peptidase